MPVFCIYDEAVAWKQDLNTVCVILNNANATEESPISLAVKSY